MLYDRVIAQGLLEPLKCPIIDGTKFSTYFFEISDREFWKLEEHFPNCRLHYEELWIEFLAPKKVHSCEYGDGQWDDSHPIRWGWRIRRKQYKELYPFQLLRGDIFEEYKNGLLGKGMCSLFFAIDALGKIKHFDEIDSIHVPDGDYIAGLGTKGPVLLSGPMDSIDKLTEEGKQHLVETYTTLMQPALLTICSMNSLDGCERRLIVEQRTQEEGLASNTNAGT